MRRVYMDEAFKARPILVRLNDNLVDTVNAIGLVKGKPSSKTTLKQYRQLLDQAGEDVEKLKQRLWDTEYALQKQK